MDWIKVSEKLPPEGVIVETKLDDSRGIRNMQKLIRKGKMWFCPDGSMYVYYIPSHWRFVLN